MSDQPQLRSEPESAFQGSVVDLAKICGWAVYHTLRSEGSEPGWPDLVLSRDDVILFRELKTEKGKVSKAQQEWIDRLLAAGLDAGVWRPSDFYPVIVPALQRRY